MALKGRVQLKWFCDPMINISKIFKWLEVWKWKEIKTVFCTKYVFFFFFVRGSLCYLRFYKTLYYFKSEKFVLVQLFLLFPIDASITIAYLHSLPSFSIFFLTGSWSADVQEICKLKEMCKSNRSSWIWNLSKIIINNNNSNQ